MASTAVPERDHFVAVKSTLPRLPFSPNADRPDCTTERLLIRALAAEDLQALHVLRTQPEVMANSSVGRVDRDLDETLTRLTPFLAPNDATTFNCAICLRETGELIGLGGCHKLESSFGWPEIGYMIRKEFWGKGLVTEFVRAWLAMWDALPREETEVLVDARVVVDSEAGVEGIRAREILVAITTEENRASQNVLKKCGFEKLVLWEDADFRDPSGNTKIKLLTWRYFPGQAK